MSGILSVAIVNITLALVFYTIGTWGERIQHVLKVWHIVFFVLGLCADTVGTTVMSNIASQMDESANVFHAITGLLAIILMAIHAVWAIWTYWKGSEKAKQMPLVVLALESGERTYPDYINVDSANFTATYTRVPAFVDVPYPVQMFPELVVEFYSR